MAVDMSSRVSDPGAARGRRISRAEQMAHYQKFAGQIQELADDEPDGALRDRLLDLVRQYKAIASRLGAKPVRH
jgi:hypothetical protein